MLPSPPDLGRIPTSELATRMSFKQGFLKSFSFNTVEHNDCRVKWCGVKFLIDYEILSWVD